MVVFCKILLVCPDASSHASLDTVTFCVAPVHLAPMTRTVSVLYASPVCGDVAPVCLSQYIALLS